MVSSLRSGRNVTFRILDVDWCTSDKVILASDDGCIRVLEMSMKSTCFRMDEQELTGMGRQWKCVCDTCLYFVQAALFQRQSCLCFISVLLSNHLSLRKYINFKLECAGLCNCRCQSFSASGLASAPSLTLCRVLCQKIKDVYIKMIHLEFRRTHQRRWI